MKTHIFPNRLTAAVCIPSTLSLPTPLLGTTFYQPSQEGYEAEVALRLAAWRRVQQEALDANESLRQADENPPVDPSR